MRHFRYALLGLLALAALLAGPTPGAQAATFTVNSTGDGGDFSAGDGVCETASGNGVCTLRAAIQEADALVGTDTIAFNIPGAGPHTITPISSLPSAFNLVIDGYTEPGASPNTNGPGLGDNAVLQVELAGRLALGGGSTVRGLAINRPGGILLFGDGNTIEGNFIGTDITGTVGLGNPLHGVLINGSNNTIGGTDPEKRNVISGNGAALPPQGRGSGVAIPDGSGNRVQGNFIGTDATGSVALGNAGGGVAIVGVGALGLVAADNMIGGTQPGAGNIISGNGDHGVSISGATATGNLVQGNLVGTDVTGTGALGNDFDGVFIFNAPDNVIGGAAAEARNVISGNGRAGVVIGGTATGNVVQGNSIFSNTSLGIELVPPGVTPNDPGDGDTGPNGLQNFPVLTPGASGTTQVTLNSTPNTTFTLEFFSNTVCDASGFGEGETFLGSTMVTTDGSGNANFVATFPPGQVITATATDPTNNTSEFSECTAAPPAVLLVHGWRDSCGTGSMMGLEQYLETNLGLAPNRADYFCYGYRAGAKSAAYGLRQRVLEFKSALGLGPNDKINIVAHSFGGLVSRYYIEKLGGAQHVDRLVMLGTPNNGTAPFIVFCASSRLAASLGIVTVDQAACDGMPNSPFIQELKGSFTSPSTQYKSIAGTGDHSPFWLNQFLLPGFPDIVDNDCVVTVASAAGPGFLTVEVPVKHSSGALLLCLGGTLLHLLNDTSLTFPEVLSGLTAGAPLAASASAGAVLAQAPIDAVSPSTGMAAGTVTQGQTNAHAVTLDSTVAGVNFTLIWEGSSSLHLTLQKPDGTIIDGSGSGVTYFPGSPPGWDGLMMERYSVDAPDVGQWTMNVQGVAVPPEGQNYQVVAFLESDVTVAFSTDKNPYLVGQPVEITAVLAQAATPLTGAAVTATVELPDDTSQQVTLRDDGLGGDLVPDDGSYFATFTSTQLCGFYQFVVSAEGTTGSATFIREDIVLIDVRVPGDGVGDPCNADDDGDGWSDAAEAIIGTDPLDGCADGPTDDANPADINIDTLFTSADMSRIASVIGQAVPPARWDIAPATPDGFFTSADLSQVAARIGTSCAPNPR